MSTMSAFSIAQSGMAAATKWLEVSAANIANAQTSGAVPTASSPSTVWRAQTVVQSSQAGGGVTTTVVNRSPGWVVAVDPNSPYADAKGRIAIPDVDMTTEAADLLGARLAYKASAKVMKVADEMTRAALDIAT